MGVCVRVLVVCMCFSAARPTIAHSHLTLEQLIFMKRRPTSLMQSYPICDCTNIYIFEKGSGAYTQ